MTMSKLSGLLKAAKLTGTTSSSFDRHFLDTGFGPLNEAITDKIDLGLPSGQIVMIAGPSASGKTAILAELFTSAQRQGGYAAQFDFETQFPHEWAETRGMLTDEDHYTYYQPDTYEEAIAKAIKLAKLIRDNDIIPKNAPIVFGFDSIHSMTPQSKYDNMMASAIKKEERVSMHDNYALSAANSAWFPVIQREFNKYGVTAIFLNQVRTKMDAMGRPYFTYPGGDSPFFYSSTVLVLGGNKIYDGTGLDRKFIRNEITCTVEKSRNTIPGTRVKWEIDMTTGGTFDHLNSYAKHLQRVGAIETSGSRVGWKGKSPYLSGVVEELRALPYAEAYDELKSIHAAFKTDGTIKYPYPKKAGKDDAE